MTFTSSAAGQDLFPSSTPQEMLDDVVSRLNAAFDAYGIGFSGSSAIDLLGTEPDAPHAYALCGQTPKEFPKDLGLNGNPAATEFVNLFQTYLPAPGPLDLVVVICGTRTMSQIAFTAEMNNKPRRFWDAPVQLASSGAGAPDTEAVFIDPYFAFDDSFEVTSATYYFQRTKTENVTYSGSMDPNWNGVTFSSRQSQAGCPSGALTSWTSSQLTHA
jgi:hypothetical protein